MSKHITGSNEHHEEIDRRIAALEAGQGNAGAERGEKDGQLQNTVAGLQGTLGTCQTIISQLQNSVSIMTTKIDSLTLRIEHVNVRITALERANQAG